MSRKTLIAGNWKMHKTRGEAQATARELVALIDGESGVEVVVCPPFTALASVGEILAGTAVRLGAQNVHWEELGAYTGEVSIGMLLDCGSDYVILGHSERRQYFQESDEMINQKVKSVLDTSLIPILCVGETLQERDGGQVEAIVRGQLETGLNEVDAASASRMVVAYEPVWAIGTGRTATPETAQEVHRMIRDFLSLCYSESLAAQIPILYGGSVKPENTRELLAQEDLDGALVGGASLDGQSFARIVQQAGVIP